MLSPSTLGNSGIGPSRKRVPNFRLFRPSSVEAACDLLAHNGGAALHAGGIDLVNRMKAGLAADCVVALGDIADLRAIRRVGEAVVIGAAATHWQIENDTLLKSCLPAVPHYVAGLGNIRIRTQGTIGGNVMAAEPAYEMLPLLAVLDAQLEFIDWSDCKQHVVPARSWTRAMATAPAGLLLTGIAIPLRFRTVTWNRELRPALGLVASLEWEGERIGSGLGAFSGDRQGPLWMELAIDKPMARSQAREQIAAIAVRWAERLPEIDSPSGLSRDYCRRVTRVMLQRALASMIEAGP